MKKTIYLIIIFIISLVILPNKTYAEEYYKITLDANGGTIWDDSSMSQKTSITLTVKEGEKLILPGINKSDNQYLLKDNDTFYGWSTAQNLCANPINPSVGYTARGNVTLYACWKSTADTTTDGKCSEECNELAPAIRLVKLGLIPVFQIGIPILLIVLGMIDFAKAVMAGKEDEMKKHQNIFIKRCIYAVGIFFVVTIVTLVFNLFSISGADSDVEGTDDWLTCWSVVGANDSCTK